MPAFAELARSVLTHEIGERASSERIAQGGSAVCNRLFAQLIPLLGEAGTRALFARSITLSRGRFPWLSEPSTPAATAQWVELRASIEGQDTDAAMAGSIHLLATFIELLGKFLGEGLAARLIQVAWPEAFSARTKKETP